MRRAFPVLVLLAALLFAPTSSVADQPPLRVLVVGDSIVDADGHVGWPARLAQLVDEHAGVTLVVKTYAVGQWSTADALPGLAAAVLGYEPDLLLFSIGTNDIGDVGGFESRYRKMLKVGLDISDARIGWSWVQYSVPGWLAVGEANINDAIYRSHVAFGGFTATGRWAGFADLQAVPVSYLDSGGVHPTDQGYQVYAQLWYTALRGAFGWPAVTFSYDPPLTGHRP